MSNKQTPIQTQGVHHITLNGADRQTSIDFWQGILGMPLVFEQPNLDAVQNNHLFFDSGDGRLLTVFTNEEYEIDKKPNPNDPGNVHHLAFNVSLATYTQVNAKLKELGIESSGEIDRGFMHSIYFRDPLGQLLELACYKFQAPTGYTNSDVLRSSHEIRVAAGDGNIEDKHIAQALADLGK
jgi:catechol 2,3-dioxygenase-like lactoylglutathione lyase family enzyme